VTKSFQRRFRYECLVLSLLAPFSAAHATAIVYEGFSDASGLTFAGDAATVSTSDGVVSRITPAAFGQSGAFYSTSAITLGGSDTFSTQFQFRLSSPGGIDPADGFTFVLAASPAGLGGAGNGLGYVGVSNSVAIEFGTYNNYLGLGPYPAAPNSSNHVAIDTDGVRTQTDVTNVYGVSSCGFTNGTPAQNPHTAAGCMSNGDLWTANITYDGNDLSVTLSDPAEGTSFTALSDVPINISSYLGTNTAYVGFTGSTGSGWENNDIVNWAFSNTANLPPDLIPEPSSLYLLGLGLVFLPLRYRARR